jgi:hypothetical protein
MVANDSPALTKAKATQELKSLSRNVLTDLDLIVQQDNGGNYAAVLLVMTACDAVGRAVFESASGGARFFRDYMLPAEWHSVAKSLFDVLRNGLAHSFETKTIVQVGDRPIELGISWRRESHLRFDQARSLIMINVKELAGKLHEALALLEAKMSSDPQLQRAFVKGRRKSRTHEVLGNANQAAWQKLLGATR